MNAWKECEDFILISEVHKIDSHDWRKTALAYFKQLPRAIHNFKNELGYYFVSTADTNLVQLIKNPPQNFEELLCPQIYQQRVSKDIDKNLN